jgi:hypothetical protein
MTDLPRQRVVNRRNQLLELHVGDQVLVLPPHGEVELPAADEIPAQVAELHRRLLVDLEPITREEAPAEKPKRTGRTTGSRRPSGSPRQAAKNSADAPPTKP